MNCHDKNKKHNPIKHILMMILCCGLPLMLVGILPFINIGGEFKTIIMAITPFICPLMMVIMIPMMIKGMNYGKCCNDKVGNSQEKIEIE